MKKFYNIEGIIRNGFNLSRDYGILDFNFVKLGDAGVQALAKSKTIKEYHAADHQRQQAGPRCRSGAGGLGVPWQPGITQTVQK